MRKSTGGLNVRIYRQVDEQKCELSPDSLHLLGPRSLEHPTRNYQMTPLLFLSILQEHKNAQTSSDKALDLCQMSSP
jgi:hypothetical protein